MQGFPLITLRRRGPTNLSGKTYYLTKRADRTEVRAENIVHNLIRPKGRYLFRGTRQKGATLIEWKAHIIHTLYSDDNINVDIMGLSFIFMMLNITHRMYCRVKDIV